GQLRRGHQAVGVLRRTGDAVPAILRTGQRLEHAFEFVAAGGLLAAYGVEARLVDVPDGLEERAWDGHAVDAAVVYSLLPGQGRDRRQVGVVLDGVAAEMRRQVGVVGAEKTRNVGHADGRQEVQQVWQVVAGHRRRELGRIVRRGGHDHLHIGVQVFVD